MFWGLTGESEAKDDSGLLFSGRVIISTDAGLLSGVTCISWFFEEHAQNVNNKLSIINFFIW